MDRYALKGAKKILSLTRTKIRLAREAGTVWCRPRPLPLVMRLAGSRVESVEQAGEYREKLASSTDYSSDKSVAATVLQCMDIIEGVKYDFEPGQYMPNLSGDDMKHIEDEARKTGGSVNILIMTKEALPGVNVYVGDDPPGGTYFMSGVPTSLSAFIEYAFSSEYFSEGECLKNVVCELGRRTLITRAIQQSLGFYGARLQPENEG